MSAVLVGLETLTPKLLASPFSLAARRSANSWEFSPGTPNMRPPVLALFISRWGTPTSCSEISCLACLKSSAHELSLPFGAVKTTAVDWGGLGHSFLLFPFLPLFFPEGLGSPRRQTPSGHGLLPCPCPPA